MRIVWPSSRLVCTTITGSALTRTWRPRTRACPAPSAWAAWTKSRPRRLRHSLRTMRATGAHVTSAMTSAVLMRLAPKSATTMRIKKSAGTDRNTSAALMTVVSTAPPR